MENTLPDDVAELVNRLNNLIILDEVGSYNKLGSEAADMLERQAREISRKELIILALKARVANWDEMAERIEELEATLDRLGNEKPIVNRGVSYICYDALELKARIEYARAALAERNE